MLGVPVITQAEAESLDEVIFMSIEYDKIINPERFHNARLFNIHFSKLPKYRGVYTSALPLLHGEHHTGVTLHLIDNGIDTGDIIDTTPIRIRSEWCCRQLYDVLMHHGGELVMKWMPSLIRAEPPAAHPQPRTNASYFSRASIDYRNIAIDFKKTAFQVCRQVKAFTFREFQLPAFGRESIVNATISSRRSTSPAGTLIEQTELHSVVATLDHDVIMHHDRLDAMIQACGRGDIRSIRRLMKNVTHIDDENNKGTTPLLAAITSGQMEAAQALIGQGADINRTTRNRIPIRSLLQAGKLTNRS